ncbi:MAG TPA: hypothetical protein PLJ12_15395, partial [Planctomycetota bacterium]|nr:hypothetical protein [Planctomycetota bacterium]
LSIGFRALTMTREHFGQTRHSTASPSNPALPMHISRIWIVNQSQGYFARELGRTIQESLLADPLLDEVAYFPASDLPLKIRRPPHLFLTYRVQDIQEHHWPGWFDFEVAVEFHLGTSPLAMPPGEEAERPSNVLAATVTYGERGLGLVTEAARYRHSLKVVVPKLDLEAVLRAWRGPEPGLADTPLAWAGAIPEVPTDLAWLKDLGAKLVVAQAPPPLLEELDWSLPGSGPQVLQVMGTRLATEGWTTRAVKGQQTDGWQGLLAHKGLRTLRAYSLNGDQPEAGPFALQQIVHPTAERLAAWCEQHADNAGSLAPLQHLLAAQPESLKRELADYVDAQSFGALRPALRKVLD